MKRYKRILILLAVLVVYCAITFGVSGYPDDPEEQPSTDEVGLSNDTETDAALSCTAGVDCFAFHL